MPRYDLVRKDGKLIAGLLADGPPSQHELQAVTAILPIRGLYGWPGLGQILRNHWAKRHGAVFDPSWLVTRSDSD